MMNDSIERVFSDRDRVIEVLNESRKLFGSWSTTEVQYEAMKKTLGFALIYCPKELRSLVDATLLEAGMREWFFVLNVWGKE